MHPVGKAAQIGKAPGSMKYWGLSSMGSDHNKLGDSGCVSQQSQDLGSIVPSPLEL